MPPVSTSRTRRSLYRPPVGEKEKPTGKPMWREVNEKRWERSDGFVVTQVTPTRVVVTHQHGLSDRDWYTLWFGNPYTAFTPMPQGLMDCMALFGEGTVYEWKAYIDRASSPKPRTPKVGVS